jgi:hypothetical protein
MDASNRSPIENQTRNKKCKKKERLKRNETTVLLKTNAVENVKAAPRGGLKNGPFSETVKKKKRSF